MSDIRNRPDKIRKTETQSETPAQIPAAAVPAAAAPDYPIDDVIAADTPTRLKAAADPVRSAILGLVMDRAATTTELATALGRPKGTVDHHVKVLEAAGLLRVVRTRQVRAITEKFWGRTARTIMFGNAHDNELPEMSFLRSAHEEMSRCPAPADGEPGFSTLRHARIPAERAHEFARRLDELTVEFTRVPRGGDVVYGLLTVLYPTDRPTLPERASVTAETT